jgi:hypothetical protein
MRALLPVLLLVAGCADLPAIPFGVCGNEAVEPDVGEDCDGSAPAGSACGAPSTPQACRYVCSANADVQCPPGFGCGLDGLCRASTSTFRAAAAKNFRASEETPLDVVVADADGDLRADVFEQTPRSIVVHYDVTNSTQTLAVARDPLLLGVGPVADLSGDGLADAVVPGGLGYFVSLGSEKRLERATAYGAVPLPLGAADIEALSAEVLPDLPGTEIIVLAMIGLDERAPALPLMTYVAIEGTFRFIATLRDAPSKLAGPARSGRLNEDDSAGTCETIVLAYQGATAIDLFVPCLREAGKTVLAGNVKPTEVKLPAGATVAGPVSLVDLNRDAHLDLVVVASRDRKYEIDVAYGRGNGTFDPVETADRTTPAGDSAGTAVIVGERKPLVVFDLNSDSKPDWVDSTGVYVSTKGGSPVIQAFNEGTPWTAAVVDRFDGDDLPDVAVGSKDAEGITVLSNAGGGVFTAFPLPTRGGTKMMTVGDFDGDKIRDLAVVNTTALETNAGAPQDTVDTLGVVFGTPFGAPSSPKSIGQFHRIKLVATARIPIGAANVVDGAEDLGALAEDEDGGNSFSVILGQGNRDLRSPIGLTDSSLSTLGVVAYQPVRFAVGDADGDGHPDVLTLSERIGVEAFTDEHRLWSNLMTKEASIRGTQSTFSAALDPSFDWRNVLMEAVDLDGVAGDEVVVLGPRRTLSGHQAAVARAVRVDGEPPTYGLSTPVPLTGEFTRTEVALAVPTQFNGRLRTADLDGDGAKDVLALARRDGRGALVVYFNDRTGQLGAEASVADAASLDVRDFAVVPSPGTQKADVALLTASGVYVVRCRDRQLTTGEGPALAMSPSSAPPPTLVSAGDLDGDGVADLALGGPGGIQVHLGISKNAKDAR